MHEIECLQTLGTSESGRQKVTALNLFYPTASPPFVKSRFFGIATQPRGRGLHFLPALLPIRFDWSLSEFAAGKTKREMKVIRRKASRKT